jgi:hypothetical protein
MTNQARTFFGMATLTIVAFALHSARADEGLAFFESKIRPLLISKCIKCHGGSEPNGGLSLEFRAGWQEAGVIEPGKPDESLLIAAVRYADPDIAMPPEDAGGKLSPAQIAALETWVQMGAPDPRETDANIENHVGRGPKLRSREFKLSDADRNYWAFQPVSRPSVPAESAGAGAIHPIDWLLLEELKKAGLEMSQLASPREQVRRAYFDLWGLPPAPEAVAEFDREPTDAQWERLINALLAFPHYGERWGRHWLDVVRYAESNGYERDGEKPNAWRYRDYVIDSFNSDKPYDQFVREQLAGDEIAEDAVGGASSGNQQWRDSIVATGFYRLHVWDDEPDSTLAAEYDDLDDIMVTTGAAFLGLTLGCARCHDHKFDPISQVDYYAFLSFFRGIDPYGRQHSGGGGRGTGRIERLLASPSELSGWQEEQNRRVKDLEERLAQATDEAKTAIEAELKQAREAKPPFDSALAVAENGPTAPVTRVLYRGDANSPRGEVSPAFPMVFGLETPHFPALEDGASYSGRRRALADWVASPRNPLTARVMVNRIWQHHFGVGLVPTPDDFGNVGLPPTNQALLDYLAAQFIESGWSIKAMHRLIMTSQAYRQSSRADNPQALRIDPENTLLWRQNLRRADAETIRDSILAVSGKLNPWQSGPSVYPTLPPDIHGGQDTSGKGWQDSPADEQNRRSIYLVVKRGLKIPLLESFDFANGTTPVGTRPVTTTAPQALMLLNDRFVQAQADVLAARVTREAGVEVDAQLTRAFQLVLQRDPTPAERTAAGKLMTRERTFSVAEGSGEADSKALISVCHGLLNVNEMIYVD